MKISLPSTKGTFWCLGWKNEALCNLKVDQDFLRIDCGGVHHWALRKFSCGADMAEAVYKVVLVGELGVGKSSIFMRYRDNIFHDNYDGTKGMDHATKVIDTGKEKVSVSSDNLKLVTIEPECLFKCSCKGNFNIICSGVVVC